MRQPKAPKATMRSPTRDMLLDTMEIVEIALSSIIRRWDDGVSPEIRDEIAIEAYQPLLRALIAARRRPLPR